MFWPYVQTVGSSLQALCALDDELPLYCDEKWPTKVDKADSCNYINFHGRSQLLLFKQLSLTSMDFKPNKTKIHISKNSILMISPRSCKLECLMQLACKIAI